VGWLGIEDRGTGGSVGSRLGGISSGQLPLGSPNRLGGDQSGEEQGDDTMSATTHSEVRSAARPMSLLAFTTASGLVGRDVCLLELGLRVAVGSERDTGFELRGGLGCHVGRDGRAILHAV
jgi:hypothetical protein